MPTVPLGHPLDPVSLTPAGGVASLPATALTRHAVCVGMTGSGKTGLCLSLLEELAQAGVPILALDPKGDLANLALVFPELGPADFRPWVDPAEAARRGLTLDALAEATARRWREGLAADGVTPADLRRFTERVQVTVRTPGSEAGVPVDVLSALTRAPAGLAGDREGLRAYVIGCVLALLGLVGRRADPLTDPAAILLARLFEDAFAAGRDLPLDVLLSQVIDPPLDRLGWFPVDEVLPPDDRRALALDLNALVASPAFAAWRTGEPLDVAALLAPRDGRTPVQVFTLAHLGDDERMFFTALLLHAVLAWSRRQPGTSSLRALVYFDEVTGYLPPHPKDPPSKAPVLTLMKQARAVGLGVVLCTQNPVDVDYKALSNAGTWLVGRLQTRQDVARVIHGLVPSHGDDGGVAEILGRLPGRTFVVRDLSGEVRVVRSRHVRSFLRGPLTRREIAALGQPWASAGGVDDGTLGAPPPAPVGVEVRWLDPAGLPALALPAPAGPEATLWRPAAVVRLRLRFQAPGWVEERVAHRLVLPLGADARPVPVPDAHLLPEAPPGGRYLPLPGRLDQLHELRRLAERLRDAAVIEELAPGPDGSPVALRADDVTLAGLALVWVPTA